MPPVQPKTSTDEHQREHDVPGRDDQLLGGRVGDGGLVATPQHVSSASAFVAWVMPTAPGVNETTFASEPEPMTHMIDSNVTGMAKAARKIPITASLQTQESERRQEGSRQVPLRVRQNRAALLRLQP